MAIPGGGGPGTPPVPGSTPPNPDAGLEKQALSERNKKLAREGLGLGVSLLGFATHVEALNSGKDLITLFRAGIGTAQGALMGGAYGERLGLQQYAAEQATQTDTLLKSLERQEGEDDATWEARLQTSVSEIKQRLRQEILILRANERMTRYGSVIRKNEQQAAEKGWKERAGEVASNIRNLFTKQRLETVKNSLKNPETYKRMGRAAVHALRFLPKMLKTKEGVKAVGKTLFYWGTPIAAAFISPALVPYAYGATFGAASVERGLRMKKAVQEYDDRNKAPEALDAGTANPRIQALLDRLVSAKEIADDEAMRNEALEFLESDEFEGLKEQDYEALAQKVEQAGKTGIIAGLVASAATYGALGLSEQFNDRPAAGGQEAGVGEAAAAAEQAADKNPIKGFFSWLFPDWAKGDGAEQAHAAAGNGATQPGLGPEDEAGVDGPAGQGAGAEGGIAGGAGTGDGGGVGNGEAGGVGNGGAGGVGDPGISGGAGDGSEGGINDGTSGGTGTGDGRGVGSGETGGVMGSDEMPGVLGPKPAPGVEQPPTPETPPTPPIIPELEKPPTGEVHPFGEPYKEGEKWYIYLDINGDNEAADGERFELKHEHNRWFVQMKYFDTDGDGRIASAEDVLDERKEKVRLYYDAQTSWGGMAGEKLTLQSVGGKEIWSSEAIYAVDKDEWMRHKLGAGEWERIHTVGTGDLKEQSVGAGETSDEYGFVPRKGLIATLGTESPSDSVPEVQVVVESDDSGKQHLVGSWHGARVEFEGTTISDEELKQLSQGDPLIEVSIKSSSLYYQESSLTFKHLTIDPSNSDAVDHFARALADPAYRGELPASVADPLGKALEKLPDTVFAKQRALEDIFGSFAGAKTMDFAGLVKTVEEKAGSVEFPAEAALANVPGKVVPNERLIELAKTPPEGASDAVKQQLAELGNALKRPDVAGCTVNYLDDKAYVRVVETDGDVLKKVIIPRADVEAALRSR